MVPSRDLPPSRVLVLAARSRSTEINQSAGGAVELGPVNQFNAGGDPERHLRAVRHITLQQVFGPGGLEGTARWFAGIGCDGRNGKRSAANTESQWRADAAGCDPAGRSGEIGVMTVAIVSSRRAASSSQATRAGVYDASTQSSLRHRMSVRGAGP